jgi:endonuclease YncB( thermonuclease family)
MVAQTECAEKLLNLQLKELKSFDLNGYNTICKVLKIYDGDTFTIGFEFASKFYKTNVRVEGIDTPELHSKIKKETLLCRLGREFAKNRYLNKLVKIEMKANDKYGRPVAVLYDYDTGESINQMMIDNKFARAYGGNLHKDEWTDDELNAGIARAEELSVRDPGK